MHRRLRAGKLPLEPFPPRRERYLAQVLAVQRQEVPGDVGCRRLLGQQFHARRGRMDAQEQRLEVEPPFPDDDDLAVEDTACGERRTQRLNELGEVPVHRPLVAALEQDLIVVAKHQRPEAVPLRLELPHFALRQPIGCARQHRRDRRREGKAHNPILVQGRDRSDMAKPAPSGAAASELPKNAEGCKPEECLWTEKSLRSRPAHRLSRSPARSSRHPYRNRRSGSTAPSSKGPLVRRSSGSPGRRCCRTSSRVFRASSITSWSATSSATPPTLPSA